MKYVTIAIVVLSALMYSGCGGPVKEKGFDLNALMEQGDCAQVLSRLGNSASTPSERGATALCVLMEADFSEVAIPQAVDRLSVSSNETGSAASANELIRLAQLAPQKGGQRQCMTVIETALGAAGYGEMGASGKLEPGSEISQELAVTALEYLGISIKRTTEMVNQNTLVTIWNSCYSLLDSSMAVSNDEDAWRLFTSMASISLKLWHPAKADNFSTVLMESTIEVIKQNPKISIAARCDVSSPYDSLKKALAKKTKLLGELERAVSAAIGCTRGRYAP